MSAGADSALAAAAAAVSAAGGSALPPSLSPIPHTLLSGSAGATEAAGAAASTAASAAAELVVHTAEVVARSRRAVLFHIIPSASLRARER